MKPALIVHGGAWDIPDEAFNACKSGCHRDLGAGWAILSGGGSALDAIEAAIMVLEDDPVFDAGYGSHLKLEGHVEWHAIVMNGATLRAGAAATLQRVKNPIQAARKILENCPHMMLVAKGAERFAKKQGIKLCKPEEMVSEAEYEAWMKCKSDKHAAEHHRGHEQGTVGAVACTGYGEAIMKVVLAKSAVDFLRRPEICVNTPGASSCDLSTADLAAREAIHLFGKRTHATGGLILLDRHGNPGFAFNTPRMAYGYVTTDGSLFTAV